MSEQLKCCKQTSALDVATQWACAELLTALGVLYHNYRIVRTPPQSQEGLYCMHDTGCSKDGGIRGRSLAVSGVEFCSVHLATTAERHTHFLKNVCTYGKGGGGWLWLYVNSYNTISTYTLVCVQPFVKTLAAKLILILIEAKTQ